MNIYTNMIHRQTRETVFPVVDTKKVCVSKYSIERSQSQHKNHPEAGKSDYTDSGIF